MHIHWKTVRQMGRDGHTERHMFGQAASQIDKKTGMHAQVPLPRVCLPPSSTSKENFPILPLQTNATEEVC